MEKAFSEEEQRQIRQARAEYMREYRRKNPAREKTNCNLYWLRRMQSAESREKLIQAAQEAEHELEYQPVTDELLAQVMCGAEILSFETIDAPVTDGYLLLIRSPAYGILFVEFSDLLSEADDPDVLSQIIAARVAVYESGEKEIRQAN